MSKAVEAEQASVYGLKDKRNQEVFYVGMSTDPYSRYGEHLCLRGEVKNSAKGIRILDMRKDGLMPELVIFEQDIPIKQAPERERYWIHFHLEQGISLTNVQYAIKTIAPVVEPVCQDAQGDVSLLTDQQILVWRIGYGSKSKVTVEQLYRLFKLNNLLDNVQGTRLNEQIAYLRTMVLNTPRVRFIRQIQKFAYYPKECIWPISAYDLMKTVFP